MHGSPIRRMLAATALGAVVALEASPAALAWTTRFGHTDAPDRTLRKGCHHYRYHYVAKPKSDDWLLETWLYDPRGKPRGSGDFLHGSDPKEGHGRFGICRSTVVPGRFTIRARLRWYTPGALPIDPPVRHQKWFKPSHFRLTRP
ncbi:MAG TPA: hypothetical protein VHR35_00505 [Nocardioides sp.]|jgi:hypothetical protein|nr:hypothetical protein [Nocardioides sp.]